MRDKLQVFLQAYRKYKLHRYRLLALLLVISLVVFGNVFWQLRYTGITMANEAMCGITEHKHTSACISYEVADLSSADIGSTELFVLSGSDVFVVSGTDACSLDNSLVVSLSDISCSDMYSAVYTCGCDEHIHDKLCYPDNTADVETEDIWESTLPDSLSGNYSEDIVSIAISQLGYSESIKNYILSDDGITKMGYTRYGEWYGNAYGKWDTMFVSFCMYYARVPSSVFPYEAGAHALMVQLKAADLYIPASDFDTSSAAGSVIFFDTDGDGDCDRTGIVSAVDDDGTVTVIEGDSFAGTLAADKINKNTYSTSDAAIMGYYTVPNIETDEEMSSFVTTLEIDESTVSSEAANSVDASDFSNYVTGITYGEFTYDSSGIYNLDDVTISFDNLTVGDVKSVNYVQKYALPSGLMISDVLAAKTFVGQQDTSGGKIDAYEFTFEKDSDGNWYVVVQWYPSYIDPLYTINVDSPLKGQLNFGEGAYVSSSSQDENGNIVIGGEVVEEGKDIIYDTNTEDNTATTPHYDLTVNKSGIYNSASNTIEYTISVFSNNGTPAENVIELSDTIISANGVNVVLPIQDYTVEQRIFKTDDYWVRSNYEKVDITESCPEPETPSTGSNLFTATLPQIKDLNLDGTEDTTNEYSTEYIITYSVKLDTISSDVTYSPKNNISINVDDTTFNEDITVNSSSTVTIQKNMLTKSCDSWNYGDQIKWTVTVNGSESTNINGYVLLDDMFADVVTVTPITDADGNVTSYEIEGEENVTLSTDTNYEWIVVDGKPAIKFTSPLSESGESTGLNQESYTVTFYTDRETTWVDTSIRNTAYLDPELGNDSVDDRLSASAYYTAYLPDVIKENTSHNYISSDSQIMELGWTSQIPVPSSGIPSGSYVTDSIGGSGSSLSSHLVHYMTSSQAENLVKNNSSLSTDGGLNNYTDVSYYFHGYDTSDSAWYYYYYDASASQWYKSIYESYDWKGTYFSYDTNSYVNYYNQISAPTTVNFTVYRIYFNSEVSAETFKEGYFTLNYSTLFDTADVTSEFTATNKIETNQYKSAEDSYTHRLSVFKTDGDNNNSDTSFDSTTGELVWKVKVAVPDDYTAGTPMEITDTLPDGVTLTAVNLKYYSYGANYESTSFNNSLSNGVISMSYSYYDAETYQWYNTTLTGTYADNKVIFNIPDLSLINQGGYDAFTLVYYCKITDVINGTYKNGQEYPLENNVTVMLNGEAYGSDSQKQTVTMIIPDIVPKRSVFNENNEEITYTVDINSLAADLNAAGDTIQMTDSLKYDATPFNQATINIDLLRGSVALYYAETDSSGKPIYYTDETFTTVTTDNIGYLKPASAVPSGKWSWTYSTEESEDGTTFCIINITAPDNKAMVLSYKYSVDTYDPDSSGTNWFGAYNTFTAADGTSTEIKTEENYAQSSGGGVVTTNVTYTIYKEDENNFSLLLNGAQFTLYKYNGTTYEKTDKVYTTGETGIEGAIVLEWDSSVFEPNTAYYLVETSAPAGYALPIDPPKVFFCKTDSSSTISAIPSEFNGFDFATAGYSGTVDITNAQAETTDLTIEKDWYNHLGEAITKTSGSVEVMLYRVASTQKPTATSPAPSEDSGTETITLDLNSKFYYQDLQCESETNTFDWTSHYVVATDTSKKFTGSNVYTYTITLNDIKDEWNNITVSGNNPCVYLQIDGLYDLLNSAGKNVEDVEAYVTIYLDNADTPFINNQKFTPSLAKLYTEYDENGNGIEGTEYYEAQIVVYNPWSSLYANKTWSEEFEISFNIILPDLTSEEETGTNAKTELPISTDSDKLAFTIDATADNNTTPTYSYANRFNAGTTIDMSIYVATPLYSNNDGSTYHWGVIPFNGTHHTQFSTVLSEDVENTDLRLYKYIYSSTLTLNEDTAFSGHLNNSQISEVVYLTAEYTEDELIQLAINNPGTVYYYLDVTEPTVGNVGSDYYIEYVGTYEVTAENNWTLKNTGLPTSGADDDGNYVYYSYFVIEKPVSLYNDSYSNVSDVVITSKVGDTITVNNTQVESYDLPETGGVGITVSISAALLLFMLAGIIFKRNLMETQAETAGSSAAVSTSQISKALIANVLSNVSSLVLKLIGAIRKKN